MRGSEHRVFVARWFEPESLVRGANALKGTNSSPHAKQVFDLMRKQEGTRLEDVAAEKAQYLSIQAQGEIVHRALRGDLRGEVGPICLKCQ